MHLNIYFSVLARVHELECRCMIHLIFNVSLLNHYENTLQQLSAWSTMWPFYWSLCDYQSDDSHVMWCWSIGIITLIHEFDLNKVSAMFALCRLLGSSCRQSLDCMKTSYLSFRSEDTKTIHFYCVWEELNIDTCQNQQFHKLYCIDVGQQIETNVWC